MKTALAAEVSVLLIVPLVAQATELTWGPQCRGGAIRDGQNGGIGNRRQS